MVLTGAWGTKGRVERRGRDLTVTTGYVSDIPGEVRGITSQGLRAPFSCPVGEGGEEMTNGVGKGGIQLVGESYGRRL